MRERLLNDPTATETLLRWGQRHQDPLAQCVALARMGEHRDRWGQIIACVEDIAPHELGQLNRALRTWHDEARYASPSTGLMNAPAFSIVRAFGFDMASEISEDVERLLSSPFSKHLTSLSFFFNDGREGGWTKVGKALSKLTIEHLYIRACRLHTEDLKSLFEAHPLQHLRSLHLQENGIGNETIDVLTTPACKYPTSCEGSILNVGG